MMKYIQKINNFTIDFFKFMGKGLHSDNQKTKVFSLMILAFVIMLILKIMNKSIKILSLEGQGDTSMFLMQTILNFIGLSFIAILLILLSISLKAINKKNVDKCNK